MHDLLEQIQQRDEKDMNRKISPLKPVDDSLVVDTSNLSIVEVEEKVMENFKIMTETAFEKLLDESLTTLNFEQGALISGVIVDLTSDWVTVHVGLKSESLIPRTEFLDEADEELSIGDEVRYLSKLLKMVMVLQEFPE